ncbi:MAG: hypothetical protein IJB61_05835 [Bacteroides sp]|nr:hypothetical protein [Bacteroides sp.]
MKRFVNCLWGLLAVVAVSVSLPSCSDDDSPVKEIVMEDNAIAGQDVGFKRMTLKIPRLGILDALFSRVNCYIHLRGEDWVTYPVNTYLSATEDTLTIEAEDAILSEMPHQKYKLSYVTFPKRQMTSRGEEAGTDTLVVGASLSASDPNNIHFTSCFDVKGNQIGCGAENDPIVIRNGEDFMTKIANKMTHGQDLEGVYFELAGDIGMLVNSMAYGTGWVPAGQHSVDAAGDNYTVFNGTLNGNRNSITDISSSGATGAGGLFYMLGPKAYIHDVMFKYISINGGDYVGTIAARSMEGARIENVELHGTVKGNNYVGGLVGEGSFQANNILSDMSVDGGSGEYLGGVVGKAGTNTVLTNCIMKGTIRASETNSVGGVSGYGGHLTNCYVSGNIEGKTGVGGLMGYLPGTDCSVKDCQVAATYGEGDVDILDYIMDDTPILRKSPLDVKGNTAVGGYFGNAELTGSNCSGKLVLDWVPENKAMISGTSSVGGFAGSCVLTGEIQNLSFESNVKVQGKERVGGFVGRLDGKHKKHDIYILINGPVVGDDGGQYIGGIVGYLTDYNALNPRLWHNKYSVIAPSCSYVGGIVGYAYANNANIKLSMLQNEGRVEGKDRVGGLIGKVAMDSNKNFIEFWGGATCGRKGSSMTVKGTEKVGGMIGELEGAELRGTLSELYANVDGVNEVGGVVGEISEDGGYLKATLGCITADLPYMEGIIQGELNVGGIVGRIEPVELIGNHYHPFGNGISPKGDITVIGKENTGGILGYICLETYDEGKYSYEVKINGQNAPSQLNGEVRSSGNYAGGVIGRIENVNCDNHMQIANWYNNMSVTCSVNSAGLAAYENYGGIVGGRGDKGFGIYIDNCANFGSIGNPAVTSSGGIVGYAIENVYIQQCYNTGTIDGIYYLGGIMGRAAYGLTIENCYNAGDVLKKSNNANHYVGGILGIKGSDTTDSPYKGEVLIRNCYNVGKSGYGIASGKNKDKFKNTYVYENCYYLNTASDGDYKDSQKESKRAKAKSADDMRKQSTYSGFDSGAWGFAEGVHAPYLENTNAVSQQPLKK